MWCSSALRIRGASLSLEGMEDKVCSTAPIFLSDHTALLLITKQIVQGYSLIIMELLFVFLDHTVLGVD